MQAIDESSGARIAPGPDRPPQTGDIPHPARDWTLVVTVGVVALLACAKVGEDVFEHETNAFDGAVQGWVVAHQAHSAVTFFYWVTTIGSVSPMVWLAVIGALFLWLKGRPLSGSAVLVAPAAAVATYVGVKAIYARNRPTALGRVFEGTYSFPSAHSTASAAICCTLAYVFWRERFIPGSIAIAFAVIVPLLVGASRVYLGAHWATDVLGGWSAGVLIAVLSAILYKQAKRWQA